MTDVCTCLDVFGEDPNCKLHGGPLRLAVFETFGARCDQFDPECETCQAWAEIDRIAELEAALNDLLDHVDRNTCLHEGVHRGGSIWTICDDCGKKWADDRGGFVPYSDPDPVARARAALKGQSNE